jgi:Calpain family cysteine protease
MRTLIQASLVLVCGLAGSTVTAPAADSSLFPSGGPRATAVTQGRLGSCYFHAVMAALAQSDPSFARRIITDNGNGTYTVKFADGKQETAYREDIRYTRDSGYDLSEGIWVAVIFRAYAQRVLREALLKAIDQSDLFALVKQYASSLIASNDPLLLAYDRAIRAAVDQDGTIDRAALENHLRAELKPIPVPDDAKESLVKLLESGGFFDGISSTIRQNGEIFGAYRAVGQGGLAERVMGTFTGDFRDVLNESEGEAESALRDLSAADRPMVACTAESQFYRQVMSGKTLPAATDSWYVNAHCYTVLGYHGDTGNVTIRNPWARHPEPDGIFNLPVATFVEAFRAIITSQR